MSSKNYPIGIQNFESLRKDNFFYIDKTALIYQLVKTGRYYFLSRPRRFGKSLLLSTLEAYFQGRKELFVGLAMEKLEKDWTEYPILHIDLNIEKYDNPESLTNILEKYLAKWEELYGANASEAGVLNNIYGDDEPIPVIFQSGYLTIKGYDKEFGLYRLGFSNKEVEEGFMKFLVPYYTRFNKVEAPFENIEKWIVE